MTNREEQINKALAEANQAKDRLWEIADKLEELGAVRKAKSCRTLVYRIEEWQHTGL